nr:unnamed protein product [Callosobruchus analis]
MEVATQSYASPLSPYFIISTSQRFSGCSLKDCTSTYLS